MVQKELRKETYNFKMSTTTGVLKRCATQAISAIYISSIVKKFFFSNISFIRGAPYVEQFIVRVICKGIGHYCKGVNNFGSQLSRVTIS